MSRATFADAVSAAMTRAGQHEMRWGVDDCALWCIDIVRDVLGYDAAESFRGRYRTRIGARRVLGRGGLPAAFRAAARRHGWQKIEPADAQAGDLGLAEIGDVVSTVICRAPGWFVGRNETGWTAVRPDVVRAAWAVL